MKKAKILLVEDDLSLGFVTKDNLEMQGYEIVHCEDGKTALNCFEGENFDLCILDVMLPALDGFSLAQAIRRSNTQIPILFLSAKAMKEDKIMGLRIGGDDYITKPFSIEELVLKIDIFLKRSQINPTAAQPSRTTIGKYVFDADNLELRFETQIQKLTLREAELLQMFIQNLNSVIKREEILVKIWKNDDYFAGRSLDVFISRLRKYLKNDPHIQLENVHSVGFRMGIRN